MDIFIDTNVILDVLLKREDFYDDSLKVLSLCENGDQSGWVYLLSIANIYYIGSKLVGREKSLETIYSLIRYLNISDGDTKTVERALHMNLSDFEDALQISIASGIDDLKLIITRSSKDYRRSDISNLTPAEFLKLNF